MSFCVCIKVSLGRYIYLNMQFSSHRKCPTYHGLPNLSPQWLSRSWKFVGAVFTLVWGTLQGLSTLPHEMVRGATCNYKSYSSFGVSPALFNSVSISFNAATKGGRENKPNMTPVTKSPGFTYTTLQQWPFILNYE